jgi:MFS family permease
MTVGDRIETPEAFAHLKTVTPGMDRINGWVFALSYVLIFFAAPVFYTDIVQAALCERLGTSATVANLPNAVNFFGSVAPFLLSWAIPYRRERDVVVWSYVIIAVSCAFTAATLLLPFGRSVRVSAVVMQALVLGLAGSASGIFMFQCVGRGTTLEGRAKAYKFAFGFSPFAAVAGSLGAQFVLNHGISWLTYPKDFALVYMVGVPCGLAAALLSTRYQLVSVPEQQRPPLLPYLAETVRNYVRVRPLVILFLAYILWFSTLAAMPNLSLYAKEVLRRDPKELAGLMMAIRFAGKGLAGYVLGAILLRWGIRAPVAVTISLLAASTIWPFFAPGYSYLALFALMGGGELGGAYFPNYLIAMCAPEVGVRNLGLLTLATPVGALAAVLHGAMTDWLGFQASFLFGFATAVIALWLVFKLPTVGGAASQNP